MNIDDIIKFISYGMTRADIMDYYNVSESELNEYIITECGIDIDKLEKQQRANLKFNIYKNLNMWMEKNPHILTYMSDRVLGPIENKSTVTVVNDTNTGAPAAGVVLGDDN